ncbi:fimbrial biogenesis chaperone [Shewanella algae]|uniref:fimbrial biogenesis chaperone n=1 Tax=Shewanella algae TaxID=38313 RepID=UPI001F188589|nr:molecular chaperone [Shewanella algae]MCE9785982.1 molecular chaperone [Shewanella algae]
MWNRCLFVTTLLFCQAATASVVMTGTRVIYPGDAKEKSVQLANNDSFPNVVQLWTDINNPQSTPENADGPFAVLPAVAKVKANGGQTVRLIYTGEALPTDRESVFYLNFLQIPPAEKASGNENKMLIMLRNRVKIFYRPEGLNIKVTEVPNLINFSVQSQANGLQVEVANASPYFASFTRGSLNYQGREVALPVEMVAPFSKVSWAVDNIKLVPQTQATINFTLVNDLGASIKQEQAVVIR